MSQPSQSDKPARVRRGFAAMSPELQREIASKGGRASHMSGHAHEFTSEEARQAANKRRKPAADQAIPPSTASRHQSAGAVVDPSVGGQEA